MKHRPTVLMVSDIITVFSGGIEMYVANVASLLRAHGYSVFSYGIQRNKKTIKRFRSFLLPCILCNLRSALGLARCCYKKKPDIIWFHSLLRYIGRLPVWVCSLFSAKKIMMYHDLGYFHPFPSLVAQENQVLPWSYGNFIQMAFDAKPMTTRYRKLLLCIAVTMKYISVSLLRLFLLRSVDTHLVPSDFMIPYLVARGIPADRVRTFPHFIVDKG